MGRTAGICPEGEKVHPLTAKEIEAIDALRAVAKRWPASLWLFSASGSLLVMQKPKEGPVYQKNLSVDPDYIVTSILGIDNDGGDF